MASTTTTTREKSSNICRRNHHRHYQEPADFNLREWCLRSQISRENTKLRRFSGSHIRTAREIVYASSFRSNITISTAASSPSYPSKDEINPSTYSFSTALKALQARAGYKSWECLSPDGFGLNSKWNEAEKYICNPLSGKVPMECLSAKTLSGRSFPSNSRITMSAPLVYSSYHHNYPRKIYTKPPSIIATVPDYDETSVHFPIQEKKTEGLGTREVGTQSCAPELSSSSPSAASTPSIIERGLKKCDSAEEGDSVDCNGNFITEGKIEEEKTRGKEETIKGEIQREERKTQENDRTWRCTSSVQVGCFSWIGKRLHRDKHKKKEYLSS